MNMAAILQPGVAGGLHVRSRTSGTLPLGQYRVPQLFRHVQLDRSQCMALPLGQLRQGSRQGGQSPTHSLQRQQQANKIAALPQALAAVAAAQAALPQWDLVCCVAAAASAYIWVKMFDLLARSGVLEQKLSRKLVHITSGPLFMLTWLFFSESPQARFYAAAVPCINIVRLLVVGSGLVSDAGMVKSMSRSGDKHELLRGPLYYVLVLAAVTALFWRENPAGLITVSMMCGGDGVADIVGRKFGTAKLPWNTGKSWAGSAAMWLAGMGMACAFFWLFCSFGYFECFQLQYVLPYLAVVCGACTVVESLPVNSWFDDNLSVPLVAAGTSMLVLPLAAAAAAGCSLPQQQHVLHMLHLG